MSLLQLVRAGWIGSSLRFGRNIVLCLNWLGLSFVMIIACYYLASLLDWVEFD